MRAFQTIQSRNLGGLNRAVISVGEFVSGTANNIIPDSASISDTVRTFETDIQAKIAARMKAICEGIATSFEVAVDMVYDPEKALLATEVAKSVVGESHVDTDTNPIFPTEDFAYMLKERPGAYLFIGQSHSAPVHHTEYVFNDKITPIGASFFATLVETVQPR